MDTINLPQNVIRSYTADALKGLGIFLVVLGHTVKEPHLSSWIYWFHMPLFFIVSGVFFKPEGWSKSIKRLLIPYIFFAVLSFIYWRFAEMKFRPLPDGFDVNRHVLDILWQTESFRFNVPLWFLPCLFFVQIVGAFLFSKLQDRRLLWIVSIVWVAFLSVSQFEIKSMWISQALYSFPFFAIGYLVGKKNFISFEKKYGNISWWCRSFAFLPLICLFLCCCRNDMMSSRYPMGYIEFFVVAIICFYCCFVLSVNLTKHKWLLWLGKNSLVIMCLHEPLKRIIIVVFSRILHMEVIAVRESIPLSILITCVTITTVIPFCIFINKKCTWVLGR